jgi:hypothetical protein
LPLNIVSSGSFTRHDLPALLATHFMGDHMERALSGVQTSMYSVGAPRELLPMTASYAASMVFYTDGSLIDGCAGFAFHQAGEGGFGYKISSPAGIFYCGAYCLVCDTATYWRGYSTPGKMLDFDGQLELS